MREGASERSQHRDEDLRRRYAEREEQIEFLRGLLSNVVEDFYIRIVAKVICASLKPLEIKL